MSSMNRRTFLQSIGSLVPVAALTGCAAGEAADTAAPMLEPPLMEALGEAVLPTELGAEGVRRVVAGFQEWLAGFEPVAELNHGYGTGEIEYAAADPAPGWGAQLRALDLQAQRKLGRAFADLPAEQRRELVRAQLDQDREERLPAIAEARHVAVGLLAYYYATPEATDLCYRASIRQRECRPLELSPQRPLPLSPTA